MVEVSILVEGGVHPNSNASADTFDNSEKLRESFQSLLSKGVQDNRIQIKIDTKGSYTSIIKMPLHSNQLALLDLDRGSITKNGAPERVSARPTPRFCVFYDTSHGKLDTFSAR